MEELDKLCFGSGLVSIVCGMGGKDSRGFGVAVFIVGGDHPEAGGGVAFSYKHEFCLVVHLTILFGEEDMTTVVAKLFYG